MIADPAGRVTYFDLPCPLLSVSYPMDLTPGSTVGHTLSNGATRIVPGTQRTNDLDRMPELHDEPRWMKLSVAGPVPAGTAFIRDIRTCAPPQLRDRPRGVADLLSALLVAGHGGTPNLSDGVSRQPAADFFAPF